MYKIEQPILQDEINKDNEFILSIFLLVVSVEIDSIMANPYIPQKSLLFKIRKLKWYLGYF